MAEKMTRRCTAWPEETWEKIKIAAKLDGRSVSSWIRSRAEAALAREIRRVVVPAPKP